MAGLFEALQNNPYAGGSFNALNATYSPPEVQPKKRQQTTDWSFDRDLRLYYKNEGGKLLFSTDQSGKSKVTIDEILKNNPERAKELLKVIDRRSGNAFYQDKGYGQLADKYGRQIFDMNQADVRAAREKRQKLTQPGEIAQGVRDSMSPNDQQSQTTYQWEPPANRTGDTNVKRFQEELSRLGYNLDPRGRNKNGGVDGLFGDDTRRAVEQFQRDNGLEVTGELDPRTQAKLEQAGGQGILKGERVNPQGGLLSGGRD